MGCNPWKTNVANTCVAYQSGTGDGVTIEFNEYPLNVIRGNGAYNIPQREGSVVMYPSVKIGPSNTLQPWASAGNCGKLYRVDPDDGEYMYVYDYYPDELSYDFGYSDCWFSYLYDTSNQQGIIGKPCYYIEDEEIVTSGGDPPQDSYTASSDCQPCNNFTCTPATTTLTYETKDPSLTGDNDCPHPTLFGFGTNSTKLAFGYDQLSTTVPNGVTDFSFSYDGVTYVDAWNQTEIGGIAYTSTQNPPYQSGDEALDDFTVYELNDVGNNKTGLRIKIETSSIYDDSGASTVFTGTRWLATEILSPGTGYAVNDIFAITYTHTHPDNTQSTLTLNIKVTGVGPYQATQGQTGFDVLRAGDTINGHSITRAFHTDLDNFPYHIIYLDGNGNDFVKDTQYTSNRNHVITAKAGYGIKDRAILIGMYEFLEKSIQYCTADVDKNAPDVFNVLVQPQVTPTITNGVLTAVNIVSGGEGWNQFGRDPDLIVTDPGIDSGTTAQLKAEWTNGVLTAVKVQLGGSGYSSTNLPQILVKNYEKTETVKLTNEINTTEVNFNTKELLKSLPDGEISVSQEEIDQYTANIDKIRLENVIDDAVPSYNIKMDPNTVKIAQMPQKKYNYTATKKLLEDTKPRYDLDYLKDSDLPKSYQAYFEGEKARDTLARAQDISDITQMVVPENRRRDEAFVETVQGPTSALPHASYYTKYMIRQYRPDPSLSTDITVKLSCSPVNTGCAHFACTAPQQSSDSTTTGGNGETITTTYTMSGLLGDGCKAWSATGTMKMWNDMTASTNQIKNATQAFGNPFSE